MSGSSKAFTSGYKSEGSLNLVLLVQFKPFRSVKSTCLSISCVNNYGKYTCTVFVSQTCIVFLFSVAYRGNLRAEELCFSSAVRCWRTWKCCISVESVSLVKLSGFVLPVAMTSSPGLLRILCVHGYRQNGNAFRERTGALRKALKKHAELVYITAPLRVTDHATQQEPAGGSQAVEPDSQAEDPRGWWFSNAQERSFHAGESCQSSLGLEESLEAVRRVVREQGPFDGILGFSQGAALVAMICALQGQAGDAQGPFSFRFAVLIAGFRSVCEEHARFYTTPVSMPTLHVFGETDRVIPDHMSRELVAGFQNPQVLTHTGGHFVPAATPQKKVYCQFLDTFISK